MLFWGFFLERSRKWEKTSKEKNLALELPSRMDYMQLDLQISTAADSQGVSRNYKNADSGLLMQHIEIDGISL